MAMRDGKDTEPRTETGTTITYSNTCNRMPLGIGRGNRLHHDRQLMMPQSQKVTIDDLRQNQPKNFDIASGVGLSKQNPPKGKNGSIGKLACCLLLHVRIRAPLSVATAVVLLPCLVLLRLLFVIAVVVGWWWCVVPVGSKEKKVRSVHSPVETYASDFTCVSEKRVVPWLSSFVSWASRSVTLFPSFFHGNDLSSHFLRRFW